MKKIFIGLLFIFIDININRLTLTPAFVGYILLYLGLSEEGECPSLETAKRWLAVGAAVCGMLWVLGILGNGSTVPFVGTVFQLASTYLLVVWAEELAPARGWDGGRVDKLRTCWYVLAVSVALGTALALLETAAALAVAATVVFFGAAVYYIYTYYRLWKDPAREEGGA